MKIAVIPTHTGLLDNKIFAYGLHRDDCFAYLRYFKEIASNRGWEVNTFDKVEIKNMDKVIVLGFYFTNKIIESILALGGNNILGLFQEPPQIEPLYYDEVITSCFGRSLIPVSTFANNKNILYHGFPVSGEALKRVAFEDRKFIVSISGWKTSKFPGSLYQERFKVINYIQRKTKYVCDIYGQGWNRKTTIPYFSPHRHFKNYKGACSSKIETLKNYKFSICFENSNNNMGYVTEKIFDSMQAGCVPIYLGAPDIRDYVPPGCFIDLRSFASYEDLVRYLHSIDKERFEKYMYNINRFLCSDSYRKRLPNNFARFLITNVEKLNNDSKSTFNNDCRKKLLAINSINLIRSKRLANKLQGILLLMIHGGTREYKKIIGSILNSVEKRFGIDVVFTRIFS